LEKDEFFDVNDIINETELKYDTDEEDNEYSKPKNASFNYDKLKNEPRFWNFDQLKTIMIRLMKSSRMRKRQNVFKKQIQTIFEEIGMINKNQLDIFKKMENQNTLFQSKTNDLDIKMKNLENSVNLQVMVIQDINEILTGKIKSMNLRNDENDIVVKSIKTNIEKLEKKSKQQDILIKEQIEIIKGDTTEVISKTKRNFDNQLLGVLNDSKNTKLESVHYLDQSKEYTYQTLTSHTNDINNLLDGFKTNLIQSQEIDKRNSTKKMQSLNDEMISIKEEYRKKDKLIEKYLVDLKNDIKNITNNIIKPTQISEAKISEVVSKQMEIQSNLKQEQIFIRDLIKKLVYAMEVSFISARNLNEQISSSSLANANKLELKPMMKAR